MTVNTITKVLMVNGTRDYVMSFSIVGQATSDESNTLVNVASGDCAAPLNTNIHTCIRLCQVNRLTRTAAVQCCIYLRYAGL